MVNERHSAQEYAHARYGLPRHVDDVEVHAPLPVEEGRHLARGAEVRLGVVQLVVTLDNATSGIHYFERVAVRFRLCCTVSVAESEACGPRQSAPLSHP